MLHKNMKLFALLVGFLVSGSSNAMKAPAILHKIAINKNGIHKFVFKGFNTIQPITYKNDLSMSSLVNENSTNSAQKSNVKTIAKISNSGYKGFDKNCKFKLYTSQKRGFHTNKPAQGPIGATIGAVLGKVIVSVAGHGTIYLIGGLTGPFAPATIIALESAFGPAIEAASLAGAVAGGIAGGVATGPL